MAQSAEGTRWYPEGNVRDIPLSICYDLLGTLYAIIKDDTFDSDYNENRIASDSLLNNEDAVSYTSQESQDWSRITYGHEGSEMALEHRPVKAVLHGRLFFLLTNGAALACFDLRERSPLFRFTPGTVLNGHTNAENVGVEVEIVDFLIQAVGDEEVMLSVVTSDIECRNSK